MTKNDFYFVNALLFSKCLDFCSDFCGHVGKRFDKKIKFT